MLSHASRVHLAAFFLLILFSAISCVPYSAFEEGRDFVFFEEDADLAFHYISSLPGDEGAVAPPCLIGALVILRILAFFELPPIFLLYDSLEHPPK